jgi:hypothetical protein
VEKDSNKATQRRGRKKQRKRERNKLTKEGGRKEMRA